MNIGKSKTKIIIKGGVKTYVSKYDKHGYASFIRNGKGDKFPIGDILRIATLFSKNLDEHKTNIDDMAPLIASKIHARGYKHQENIYTKNMIDAVKMYLVSHVNIWLKPAQ